MTEYKEKKTITENNLSGATTAGTGVVSAAPAIATASGTTTAIPAPGIVPDIPDEEDEKKRKKRLILIIVCIVAASLITFLLHELGVFKFPWDKEHVPIVAGDIFPGDGGADGGHLPNMTPEEIKAQMQKVADASYFSFKINARPEFKNGSAAGTLGIENPNNNIYPMVVQIFLDDTEELIYDSGGILPDHHIASAKLSKKLKAGTYKATAYMNAYDPDTKKWLGKQAAALEITVKN
jgi:hypothetical protein